MLFWIQLFLTAVVPLLCAAQRKELSAEMQQYYNCSSNIIIKDFNRQHIPLNGADVPCIPSRKDALYGFVDKKTGNWVVKPQYEQVFAVYPEGAIVGDRDRYGLLNYQDTFIIAPYFSNLIKEGDIYHGMFYAVDTGIHPEHYRSFVANYYITAKGRLLFAARAHEQHSFAPGDTMAWFRYADTFSVYGKSGALLQKIHYDKKKLFAGIFNNCFVYREDEPDFIGFRWYDGKGKMLYKIPVADRSVRYVYRLNSNMYALISEEGIRFTDTNRIYYPLAVDNGMVFPGYAQMYDGLLNEWISEDGLIPVTNMQTEQMGLLSGDGTLTVPCKYKYIGPFVNGRAAFMTNSTLKIGFLNRKGEVVMPPVLGEENANRLTFMNLPLYYSEGLCPISIGKRMIRENDLNTDYFGYADSTGKTVLIMPDSIVFAGNFSSGLAPVISKSRALGFINKKGETVIPFKYEAAVTGGYPFPEIVMPQFINGYAYLKAFKGYIDSTGKEYFSGKRMQDHYDFSH